LAGWLFGAGRLSEPLVWWADWLFGWLAGLVVVWLARWFFGLLVSL
jgi:hypothetical protein